MHSNVAASTRSSSSGSGTPWRATITTRAEFRCSTQTLFEYITTPARWHEWHPATADVRDVPNRPLATGETVVERIRTPMGDFDALWTVITCVRAELWVIATQTARGDAQITYRVTPIAGGCRFERTLQYRSHPPFTRWLDNTLTRWLLTRQSKRALANLQHVLVRKPVAANTR